MTDTDPARVALRYTGTHPVTLVGSAHPRPGTVHPGDIVAVEGWAAPGLVESGAFVTVEAAAEDLKGAALDDALAAAGLPVSGRVADKRARLAEHLAGQADPGATPDLETSPDGETTSTDAEGEQDR